MDKVIEFALGFPTWVRVLILLFTVGGAGFGAAARYHAYKGERIRQKLAEDEFAGKFLKQFNAGEIRRWMSDYVAPKCSTVDPTNRDGDEYLADIRQPIFDHMDNNISNKDRSYHLLLADTGMGKTMFCINYYVHAKKKFKDLNICLVSLASDQAGNIIRSVSNKSESILIADALDEDIKALGRGRERLSEILEMSADFKSVIITCRSQYFTSDDAIPRETPLPVLVPRKLGQTQNSALIRSYISPFSKNEVNEYLSKIFPIYKPWLLKHRSRAKALIESVPDLVHRPMLLERLPDLAKAPSQNTELYELYDLLVNGWMERENRWITFENLKVISLELALQMYRDFDQRHGRMNLRDINYVAESLIHKNPEWDYLSSRSLLNRDSAGMYKFAHKSILEFLVVKAACEGDDRAYTVPWTAFMKELFISWGHSESGKSLWKRARNILSSENGRQHIAPLYDMLSTSAVRGYPDHNQICERRSISTGERIAPASWRESSIEIFENDKKFEIIDREYNLRWTYIPNYRSPDITPLRPLEVLTLQHSHPNYRFPSLEQLVCLVEGLYRVKSDTIPQNSRFIIGDKPGKNTYLIVDLNPESSFDKVAKTVWKKKRIIGTSIYLTCYQVYSYSINDLPASLTVDQLYIDDNSGQLI